MVLRRWSPTNGGPHGVASFFCKPTYCVHISGTITSIASLTEEGLIDAGVGLNLVSKASYRKNGRGTSSQLNWHYYEWGPVKSLMSMTFIGLHWRVTRTSLVWSRRKAPRRPIARDIAQKTIHMSDILNHQNIFPWHSKHVAIITPRTINPIYIDNDVTVLHVKMNSHYNSMREKHYLYCIVRQNSISVYTKATVVVCCQSAGLWRLRHITIALNIEARWLCEMKWIFYLVSCFMSTKWTWRLKASLIQLRL